MAERPAVREPLAAGLPYLFLSNPLVLAETPLLVRDLLKMRKGDVIPIDIPGLVVAEVDGVPVFECKVGILNGQHAVRIEKVLATPQSENSLGDEDGV